MSDFEGTPSLPWRHYDPWKLEAKPAEFMRGGLWSTSSEKKGRRSGSSLAISWEDYL